MSERFVIFGVFLLATLCLHLNAIDVTTTWLDDNILNDNAQLQCSWTTTIGEAPAILFFTPNNNTCSYYFSCVVNTDPPYSCARGPSAQNRHSFISSLRGSVTMVINRLNCSDDETSYFCSVGEDFKTPNISQSSLRVKVRPFFNVLVEVQPIVQENSNFDASCYGDLGYPNAGHIVWKAYQNGQGVDISSEILISIENTLLPVDDKCKTFVRSRITLKANRLYQNISLACFVIHEDFNPTVPETCNYPITKFCFWTSSVNITYPVSSVSVTREPASTLYEGKTVILKCQADGNPLPTYSWTKVGDENRTLYSEMDGLHSTVTLTSLNKTLDSGDYNCTATNVIKHVYYGTLATFTTFGVIPLVIYEATTLAPTTTTASKQTISSTSTEANSIPENTNAVNNSDEATTLAPTTTTASKQTISSTSTETNSLSENTNTVNNSDEATTPATTTTTKITTSTTTSKQTSTSSAATNSPENISVVNNSDSNKVSMIAIGVILSSIIIEKLLSF